MIQSSASLDGVVWTVEDEPSLYCGSITDPKRSESILAVHLKARPGLFSFGRSSMSDSGGEKIEHRTLLFPGLVITLKRLLPLEIILKRLLPLEITLKRLLPLEITLRSKTMKTSKAMKTSQNNENKQDNENNANKPKQ
jgi:hypothetical protein